MDYSLLFHPDIYLIPEISVSYLMSRGIESHRCAPEEGIVEEPLLIRTLQLNNSPKQEAASGESRTIFCNFTIGQQSNFRERMDCKMWISKDSSSVMHVIF